MLTTIARFFPEQLLARCRLLCQPVGMGPISILILAAFLLVLIALWRSRSRQPAFPALPTASLPSLGQRDAFLRVLLGAVPPGLVVCPKVRLMDVVSVPDDLWREYGAEDLACLDFVLADTNTLEPKLVIELDDRSHRLESSRQRAGLAHDLHQLPEPHVDAEERSQRFRLGVQRQVVEADQQRFEFTGLLANRPQVGQGHHYASGLDRGAFLLRHA